MEIYVSSIVTIRVYRVTSSREKFPHQGSEHVSSKAWNIKRTRDRSRNGHREKRLNQTQRSNRPRGDSDAIWVRGDDSVHFYVRMAKMRFYRGKIEEVKIHAAGKRSIYTAFKAWRCFPGTAMLTLEESRPASSRRRKAAQTRKLRSFSRRLLSSRDKRREQDWKRRVKIEVSRKSHISDYDRHNMVQTENL